MQVKLSIGSVILALMCKTHYKFSNAQGIKTKIFLIIVGPNTVLVIN